MNVASWETEEEDGLIGKNRDAGPIGISAHKSQVTTPVLTFAFRRKPFPEFSVTDEVLRDLSLLRSVED